MNNRIQSLNYTNPIQITEFIMCLLLESKIPRPCSLDACDVLEIILSFVVYQILDKNK